MLLSSKLKLLYLLNTRTSMNMHTFFVVLFDSWIGSGKGARGRGRGKDLEGGGDNVSMATATSLSSLLRILLIRVVGCFFFF